ncbi:SsrA-binding protein SmpB [Candidatus Saccharibacteria bacterium]|nr:SsrA-binding protein SmpB [Candidatus Saccharibacteria bacterium]
MAKKKTNPGTIKNRRARFDYDLGDDIVAGLVLTGPETKALRMHLGQLRGAYVTVKDNELWLLNATISGTNGIPISESEQTRSRKILVNKKQIAALMAAKQQGKSIIPTDILTKGRYIKVRIAVGTGKKRYDKRETIKQRDQNRDTARTLAQYK